ncbi:MAG TPA: DUF1616 domain-containing protein [Solirubrobacterales bacterium]
MSENRDLTVVAGAAVALAAAALAVPVEWLSLLLLAPLAFLLPGYAIVAACFTRKPPAPPQLAALSIAISLAVLALLSLPLNYLGGLTPLSWALGLTLVTLLACGIAVAFRPPPQPRDSAPLRLPKVGRLNAAVALAGVLAAAAAIVLAFTPLSASHAEGFTALWIRPFDGPAGAGVRVGVGSEEKQPTSYRLEVHFAGSGAPIERRLELEPGQTSVLRALAAPQPTPGTPRFVSATLYLAGQPSRAYRNVYAWVPAEESG